MTKIITAHGERAFIEYTLDVYIHLYDKLLESDEDSILTRIRRDGYHYYQVFTPSPAHKFTRSFCCRCSQDYDVQRQVFNVDRRRLDSRMETYFCGGHIQVLIDKRNRYAHINVEHSTGHLALQTHQPQVYYWWNRSFETQYKLANNQYKSARLLIERALPHGVDK
ncbi:hypothetical protein BDA99DRAFT_509055, partial [Phascolomyces articulosus]